MRHQIPGNPSPDWMLTAVSEYCIFALRFRFFIVPLNVPVKVSLLVLFILEVFNNFDLLFRSDVLLAGVKDSLLVLFIFRVFGNFDLRFRSGVLFKVCSKTTFLFTAPPAFPLSGAAAASAWGILDVGFCRFGIRVSLTSSSDDDDEDSGDGGFATAGC